MLDKIKSYKNIILSFLGVIIFLAVLSIIYIGGYKSGYNDGLQNAKPKTVYKNVTIPGDVNTKTDTSIAYVPKTNSKINSSKKDADIDAAINKPEITVRVNGQEQTIHKSSQEKFVFDENKLLLNQTTHATVDIKVPTIDSTRRWSAGIGYGNHGLAGKIDFPISKSNKVGGWIAGDQSTAIIGISIKF